MGEHGQEMSTWCHCPKFGDRLDQPDIQTAFSSSTAHLSNYIDNIHKQPTLNKGEHLLRFDCCCVKRALNVSELHNFVTIQNTDMYITSF